MSTTVNRAKKMRQGLLLMAGFVAVFIAIFLPIFGDGHNGLNYMDNLYNSISKDSAYYIPKVMRQAEEHRGEAVNLNLALGGAPLAGRVAELMTTAGAQAQAQGNAVLVSGDLGAILHSALTDSDAMFHNEGQKVAARYNGADPRAMLYSWHQALTAMEKDLNRQKLFPLAQFAHTVQTRAVETAYNYYGIQPQSIGDRWLIVVVSLLFYVVYTMWYGFGVMFMFEGSGMDLSH